ncbi:MAG: protease HtpX [Pseudomonadota bacterium]
MRVLLLIATNLAVVILASITLNLLGVGPWLSHAGLDYGSLVITGLVFGFGGAFFSLAISKWSAKHMMGVQLITSPRDEREAWLLSTVTRLAAAANIGTPEVGIFESEAPNAFATGATRNHALVAVSTGLLAQMGRAEVEAVLGHEITHVANGDMVTLTLVQGVVNTFAFVLSRVIGSIIDSALSRGENNERRGPGIGFWVGSLVAQVILTFLGSLVVMWFSRRREFRADAGGAHLAGRQSMIAALQALKRGESGALPQKLEAMGIAGDERVGGLRRLMMSHPPLDERIEALRNAT